MSDKPLLILPRPRPPVPRVPQGGGSPSRLRRPSFERQRERFLPQFQQMIEAFVVDEPTGLNPENILVLETAGQFDDFKKAVGQVDGLEWLAESDMEGLTSDEIFYERPKIGVRFFSTNIPGVDSKKSKQIYLALLEGNLLDKLAKNTYCLSEGVTVEALQETLPEELKGLSEYVLEAIEEKQKKPLEGRVYLSLSNRQALEKIRTLFERGTPKVDLPGPWAEIFSMLRVVRYWDVEDRIRDTGIIDFWNQEVELKRGTV